MAASRCDRPCVRRVSGLTLIELLVVIVTLGLLVAVLLPSLSAALEQARSIKCLSNLRAQMQACYAYAQEDRGENLVPIHPRYTHINRYRFRGYLSPGQFFNAARKTYGGKSGRHDFMDAFASGPYRRPGSGGFGQIEYEYAKGRRSHGARYSTGAGMGPATRPLNRYLYRDIQDRLNAPWVSQVSLRQDEHLEMDLFKCPSDSGYDGGKDGGGVWGAGIYLGMGVWYNSSRSFYDNLGNSYATDSYLIGWPGLPIVSIGPFARPYSQIPNTSRVTILKETKGFYAASWNSWGQLSDRNLYVWGNHGKFQVINTAFVDGHAAPTKFDLLTDTAVADGYVYHTGNYERRGGSVEQTEVTGMLPKHGGRGFISATFGTGDRPGLAHLIKYGEGRQDHTFPAPTVTPGPDW